MQASPEMTEAPAGELGASGANGITHAANVGEGVDATCTGYGATPDEWLHLDLILGLGEHLLPVVSNPNAPISINSTLTERGKTPSQYDAIKRIVGIKGWTQKRPTGGEIERWSQEPDYGICVQTREIRAIDVDVTDAGLADQIRQHIAITLGLPLPCRSRSNSSKFLHPFRLVGEYGKRVIHVSEDGQKIEFLMTGQQFIAIGRHPSGVHYEWEGGLPSEIPTLPADVFEALFNSLQERFGIKEPTISGASQRKKAKHLENVTDSAVAYLNDKGLILDEHDGGLVVACPWEGEHTMGETGDRRTLYYPAGSNGRTDPGFKCMHGHCEGRNFRDYWQAIGYVENRAGDYEDCSPPITTPALLPLPAFARDQDGGKIKATKANAIEACKRSDICGKQLRYDSFRDEIMLAPPGTDDWRAFKDTDYTALCLVLETGDQGFKNIPKELIRDAVAYSAEQYTFDSARHWLDLQQWDNVPRVERFLINCFGAEDTAYVRAVARYFWTALAGRVIEPGIKADMVPVAFGRQGSMKSSAVAQIVPAEDFFMELDISAKDDDLARLMRGKLVIELGELRGLRKKDVEHIKAFITRTHEKWIPKWKEMSTSYARRCLFFGTTNRSDFLVDDTGHRRWLPFTVAKECDPDAVKRDRGQLWAEARELFNANGVEWQAAERLADGEHEKFVVRDPWEEIIERWLTTPDTLTGKAPGDAPFTAVQALREGVTMIECNIKQADKDRMSRVLRELGYSTSKKRINGKQARIYERGE